MNKTETLNYLDQHNVHYEITEHKAVYNMAELNELHLPYPEADAKNLFVRDNKKRHYYLLTVKGNKRVNLNDFRKANGTTRLSFASPEDLTSKLHLKPGAVTPIGLLNDASCQIPLYIDSYFSGKQLIGIHPNDNTATVWLKSADLIALIKEHGNPVHIIAM